MTAPLRTPPCVVVGCVGLPYCVYCGEPMPDPDSRAVLTAAGCLRRGDTYGALRLLQSAARTP